MLVIAEKPSVAKSIADAIGAKNKKDGYFEGNGYYVSFAFGHLYELYDTKDYDEGMSEWKLEDYPYIPSKFIYKLKNDDGIKKQINTIKELIDRSSVIVNACDYDREGSLIFAEIRNDLSIKKTMKRLWMKSNTPKAIHEAINNLSDLPFNQESAGYCRQQVDWLLGINLTVVFSLKAGGELTLKLGRVILPTLKLIYDREFEIANFRSQTFFNLKCKFSSSSNSNDFYIGTYIDNNGNNKILDMNIIKSIQAAIEGKQGKVIKKESKRINESSPKLFNLTDLQGFITSKYKGFTSNKVLDVMQSLYEKKYLTYPRTASRCLDDTQVKDAEESLNAVLNIAELNVKKESVKFITDKKIFDSSKVDSHPALTPTYVIPNLSELSEDEKIVYIEVTKRFISQFLPPAIYDTVEIETMVDNYKFITKGKVLIEKGWKQLYSNSVDEESNKEDDTEEAITAKNINVDDVVLINETEAREGKTNPPAHYTEKSLLSAMESCGKNIKDEDIEEEVLKGYTIGTPATRGDVIQKLYDCNYVISKGKNILITDLGAKVINYFPVKRLLKTSFTGQIEKTLKDIEEGNYSSQEFMSKMETYISKNINEMKESTMQQIKKPVNIIGKCPKCGKNVIENSKAYSCEGTKNSECNFVLFKDNNFFKKFGKKLTENAAKELIKNGKTLVKGLKSTKKEGIKFDAIIHLEENKETGYWGFRLEFDNKKSSKSKFKKFK